MNPTLRTDAFITAMTIAIIMTITLTKGDVLFIGHWYYASVFLGIFTLPALAKAKPLFISGAILAATLTFGFYIRANWAPSTTNDLLVLGHVFSLPGAAIGLLLTGIISRFSKHNQPALAFITGALGFGVGFLINQLLLCSTVLYCGALINV